MPKTPKNKDVGRGLRKIVAYSQPYLAVLSCIYSFWHGVIPTSILMIFTLVVCRDGAEAAVKPAHARTLRL